MKQLNITFLLAVLMSMVGAKALAYDAKIDGIYYSFSGTSAIVTCRYDDGSGYSSMDYSGNVVIPNSITYDGVTYQVVGIDDYAFFECNSLLSVTIPNSVTSIGSNAFQACTSLTSVHIKDLSAWCDISFSSSNSNPLYYAHHLYLNGEEVIDLVIPDGVTSIGVWAFCNCSSLTSITIPNSVSSIGGGAFSGTAWYNNQPDGIVYAGKVVYTYKGTMPENTIIDLEEGTLAITSDAFSRCNGLTSITIPNSVTSIGGYAFYECSGLTSVTIPNSVTSIGYNAFEGTGWYKSQPDGLVYAGRIAYKYKGTMPENTKIDIEEGTLAIISNAFSECSGLTSVTIPASVKNIGTMAFPDCKIIVDKNNPKYDSRDNCNGIIETASNTLIVGNSNTIIPNSVTSIGDYAFRYCKGLTSINIPNSVTSIGAYAFYDCDGLTSITIPNSVTSISKRAFEDCDGLTSVIIPNSVTKIGEEAFYSCGNLTSVTIPNSVINIEEAAFCRCRKLTSVIIGNGVKLINYAAFSKCTALTDVYCFSQNIPQTEPSVFYNAQSGTLHVPSSSLSAYKSKDPWKSFGKIVGFTDTNINKLTIGNLKSKKGQQVILPIGLKNMRQITGIQFDLYLPSNISVARKANGKMIVETTNRMEGNYTIIGNTMDNFVRIIGYSTDGDVFTGNEGTILNVTLNIPEDIADGDYTIYLKDIVLSEVDNTEYHPANVSATLTVKSDMLGDVDGSGVININDVVCIINYILGKTVNNFIVEAADVDGSGSININDVVTIINRYILMKTSAPALFAENASHRAVSVDKNFLHLEDINIDPGETKEIKMLMTNTGTVAAIQGKLMLPAGLSIVKKSNGRVDAQNINARSEDFTLSTNVLDDGSLTFAQYSADGFTYEGNTGGIFTFKIKADETATAGTYSVTLSNVVLSIDGVGYEIPDRTSSLTVTGTSGISNVNVNENDNRYYTLDGQLMQGEPTQKGVYIVNGHKVVIK